MSDVPDDSTVGFDPLAGRVIQGRWRLIERLGEGGMGVVYLAEQLSIRGRKVAVKLLHPEFARAPQYVKRFRAEAERAAAVSDPRVVVVLDFGQAESGELFIAMEYVAGDTLSSLVREGPLPLARAVSFGAQLADALHQVHEAGILHRDVKPANVMIRRGSDDLKLMDFGVSRSLASNAEQTQITRTGSAVGTPSFMAPEQISGGAISRQTDIYSWGVVMYAMLAGRRPFEASSPTVVQYQHVHEPPPPLRDARRDIPDSVERIVMRTLEKKPEDRPKTMAEVATALRAVRLAPELSPEQQPPAEPRARRPATSARSSRAEMARGVAAPAWGSTRDDARHWSRGKLPLVVGSGMLAVVALGASSPFLLDAWGPASRPEPSPPPEASRSLEPPMLLAPLPTASPDSAIPAAEPRATGSAARVSEALALARFHLDEGDYESAIAELSSALSAEPANEELRTALDSARRGKEAERSLFGTEP